MIDILVPVLSRPGNAQPLADSIAAATTTPWNLVFICTPGDDRQIAAAEATGHPVLAVEGSEHQYPIKVNTAFRHTANPWVMIGGDDYDFHPGWDTKALRAGERTGAGVVGLNDCANPSVQRGSFSTSPLIRRSYIDEQGGTFTDGPGVVLHEGYDHNYVDVELAEVAKARNLWVFVKDARVCHRHPGWKTAPDDATYEKGRVHFREDGRLFLRRRQQFTRLARRR